MSQQERTLQSVFSQQAWRIRLLLKMCARMRIGRLRVKLADGSRYDFAGDTAGPQAEIELYSAAVIGRILRAGSIGFADSYMAGEWDSPDLSALIYLLHINEPYVMPDMPVLQFAAGVMRRLGHRRRRNDRRGARRNIAYHYDLGNDFYRLWLDETWTYSSAVFQAPAQELAEAQRHKYQLLLDRLALKPEHHLLEIGCGWGGFAVYVAQTTGCRVTGITLSTEQLAQARAQAEAAGVADRVVFRLLDYRDVTGAFDRVASIEMYEAVGERYWPAYFGAVHKLLVPGGRAAIQAITIAEGSFAHYRENVDFIQQYVFPGGMLASPSVFADAARAQDLIPANAAFYGVDYAETLRRWHRRVLRKAGVIREQFDERFLRMWRYYLAYCEAGFESGNIDLMQITLNKG